jgi:serine/threonine protein kinase
LLDDNLGVKICDFGLSRPVKKSQEGREGDGTLTEYVVSRHYRAPEVMTNPSHYDRKVDVWSVGCILAEFYSGKVLFKGDDCLKQLQLILTLVGTPSEEELAAVHPNAAKYIRRLGAIQKADLIQIFPSADPLARDLISSMLQFSPEKRISVEKALEHPWFRPMFEDPYFIALSQQLGLSKDGKQLPSPEPLDLEWDRPGLQKDELLRRLCHEIVAIRPDSRALLQMDEDARPAPAAPASGELPPAERAEPAPAASSSSSSSQVEPQVKEEKKDQEQPHHNKDKDHNKDHPAKSSADGGDAEQKSSQDKPEKQEQKVLPINKELGKAMVSPAASGASHGSRDELLRGGRGPSGATVAFKPNIPYLSCLARPDK